MQCFRSGQTEQDIEKISLIVIVDLKMVDFMILIYRSLCRFHWDLNTKFVKFLWKIMIHTKIQMNTNCAHLFILLYKSTGTFTCYACRMQIAGTTFRLANFIFNVKPNTKRFGTGFVKMPHSLAM